MGGVPLLFALGVVLVIALGIYGGIQARKRREDLLALSQRLGLRFDADKDYALAKQFSFLKEFSSGSNRYATNILSGLYQQEQVIVFDYHYETQSTDGNGHTSTTDHWFSFLLLKLPGAFPELIIRREGLLTRIAEAFGYQAIKFESAEFSNSFCVRSPDKKFAYDVCNAQMIEYLLANRDLSIEIENQVVALAFNNRLSAEQIEFDLRRLIEIRGRLPQYLFTNA